MVISICIDNLRITSDYLIIMVGLSVVRMAVIDDSGDNTAGAHFNIDVILLV